jgi:signal transduction histidine kinase
VTPISLRTRVLLGAVLWTTGLFFVTGIVTTILMIHHPESPRILHSMFEHSLFSCSMAIACMIAGLWQVRRGLSPVHQLRSKLSAVRDGGDRRVDGTYPAEVQPLVDDLNALLDHRERAVARAVSKAGDLAHGLKTPLAVIGREVERVDASGHPELAASIAQQVERMRRQIDYHLAHARAAASGAAPGARCSVLDSADGLARTLRRLHADRGMAIDVCVPQGHAVRAQREDVDEMLGNLLDNACKWARSRVVVGSAPAGGAVDITIDDDGPGVAAAMRDAVLQRGVRADQAASGSGLGLAIVRDLAELYGGSIALETSAAGGLRARLRLPAC